MKNVKKKIIVFEEITLKNAWLVKLYLRWGFEVYYWRMVSKIKNSPQIQALPVKKVSFETLLHFNEGIADTHAFHNVDTFFPIFIIANPFLLRAKELYQSDKYKLAIKNFLMKKLARFYYLNKNLARLSEVLGKEGEVWFVPNRTMNIFQVSGSDLVDYFYFDRNASQLQAERYEHPFVRFPFWTVAISYIHNCLEKLYALFNLFGLLSFLWINRRVGQKTGAQKFKYGIMILSNRQFENQAKPVEFIIDGALIKKEDVVFIPFNKLSEEQIRYFKERHLNYVTEINRHFDMARIKKAVKEIVRMVLFMLSADVDCFNHHLRMIFYYVKWGSLANRVELEHLVTQNTDTVQQSVARDLMYKIKNTTLWKYMDSAALVNYFMPFDQFLTTKEISFAYMYCDHLVSWTEDNTRAFKTTKSSISYYWETGCFWAEYVKLIKEQKISRLDEILKDKGYNPSMKIIGVFDTSYGDLIMNKYEDGIKFIQGIKKLLEDFPDIFVILKEKKARALLEEESPALIALYNELDNHPRFKTMKNNASPSEIIAISDIIISYPYTSTTIEGLASGRKSLWYDPSQKYVYTFYDQISGLVMHNYQELRERIKELLYQRSDNDYENYLKNTVNSHFKIYQDQSAITRFRQMLTGEFKARTKLSVKEMI